MTEFKSLDDHTLVSGQISVADLEEARRHGVTMIVNNRPDGAVPSWAAATRSARRPRP